MTVVRWQTSSWPHIWRAEFGVQSPFFEAGKQMETGR